MSSMDHIQDWTKIHQIHIFSIFLQNRLLSTVKCIYAISLNACSDLLFATFCVLYLKIAPWTPSSSSSSSSALYNHYHHQHWVCCWLVVFAYCTLASCILFATHTIALLHDTQNCTIALLHKKHCNKRQINTNNTLDKKTIHREIYQTVTVALPVKSQCFPWWHLGAGDR